MNGKTPDPPRERTFSPDRKNWVDILEYGEIAMGAVKREYLTSFPIDGESSFILVAGNCRFLDSNRFLLWDFDTVILNYILENQTFHLSREEVGVDCRRIDIDALNLVDPTIVLLRADDAIERVTLSSSLAIFSPGRSSISSFLTKRQ
jgi:hypothetical protein